MSLTQTALSIMVEDGFNTLTQEMFFREMESLTPPPQEEHSLGPRQKSFPAYKPNNLRAVRQQQHPETRTPVKKYDPLSLASAVTNISSPTRSLPVSPNKRSAGSNMNQEQPQAKNLVILDWDDTLHPTSFISEIHKKLQLQTQSNSSKNTQDRSNAAFTVPLTIQQLQTLTLPQDIVAKIAELEKLAIDFVHMCSSKADVVIVSNSDQGWVEYTGTMYMPRLLKYIQRADIKIVSARHMYEAFFPDDLTMWKVQAFMAEIQTREASLKTLVSIGDGEYERSAAKVCAANMPRMRVQAMKFVAQPDIEQLKKQLQLSESILTGLLPSN